MENIATHFLTRVHNPKLLQEAFRRFKIAPKITKALRYRRYHLKRLAFFALFKNKIQIIKDRNECTTKELKSRSYFVKKFFKAFKASWLIFQKKNRKAT